MHGLVRDPVLIQHPCGSLFEASYHDDGSLQVVEANKVQRREAAGEAEVLLQQEQLSFEAWRDSLETVPTIKVGPLRKFPSRYQESVRQVACETPQVTCHPRLAFCHQFLA